MSKEKVFLKKKDFDVRINDGGFDLTNYADHKDCPLARACKRHFKTENVEVGAFDLGVEIDGETWTNDEEWGCHIANNVARCKHIDGDKTQYYVTLTKK